MNLDHTDKNRIRSFYVNLLQKYGINSAKTLDWHARGNQAERYETFTILGNLNDCSILDFGCGLGDLYGFLEKRYNGFSYLGIDIVPELVEEAKKKYPAASFKIANVFELSEEFDYSFASGSLSYKVKEGPEFYYAVIRRLYDISRIGVGFNMLDGIDYDSDETYQTYNPEEVLKYCKTFAQKIRLVTEYEEGDFTILLEK